MKAVKMINSTVLAFHRINPFPVAASQKLSFGTTADGNRKKPLKDQEIQITPFSKLTDMLKPAINTVKKFAHLLEFCEDYKGDYKCRIRTELFPNFFKSDIHMRVVAGKEGTMYFIPIPGISVIETDGELNVFAHGGKLHVLAYKCSSKVGGDIAYDYLVALPAGFTMDDLTIDHDNGQMMVLVPYRKKAELVSKEEVGRHEQEVKLP